MRTGNAKVIKGGFKTVLATSLRDYRVTLAGANSIIVQAHLQDRGKAAGRHLSFMTVQPNGEIVISHVIHGAIWGKIKDVTPVARIAAFRKVKRLEAAQQRAA